MVLLQFSWRRGPKDSRGQGFKCLFSKDLISAFNILSISAMSFFAVHNSSFSIKPKSLSRHSDYDVLICAGLGGHSGLVIKGPNIKNHNREPLAALPG